MHGSKYIDCEYYVKSLDQASLTLNGVTVDSPIALELFLIELAGRSGGSTAEDSATALARGIENLIVSSGVPEMGQTLFEVLFPESSEVRSLYLKHRHHRLRFMLRLNPEVDFLHALPWEILTERLRPRETTQNSSRTLRHFARGEQDLFLRHVDQKCHLKILKDHPLRVLVAVVSPENFDQQKIHSNVNSEIFEASLLDIARLRSELVGVLDQYTATYEVHHLKTPVTLEKLNYQLRTGDFHVLHLIAHGYHRDGEAGILLQERQSSLICVPTEKFADAIPTTDSLRLINLMVCGSAQPAGPGLRDSLASRLVAKGFPAVVAMGREITPKDAATFSKGFYRSLHLKGDVDYAVNHGRHALHLEPSPHGLTKPGRPASDWSIPVLFTQRDSRRIWRTLQEAARWRRRVKATLPFVAAALLVIVSIALGKHYQKPIAAVVKAGEVDNTSLALVEVFKEALDATDSVTVHEAMPLRGRPYLMITVPDHTVREDSTFISFTCVQVGFPSRPTWWPRRRAQRQCAGKDIQIPLARGQWLSQISNGVTRIFDGTAAPETPILGLYVARKIAENSMAHLLLDPIDKPENSGSHRANADFTAYFDGLKFSIDPKTETGAGMVAKMFLRAQWLKYSAHKNRVSNRNKANTDLAKAAKLYALLSTDLYVSVVPIDKTFLNIQKYQNLATAGQPAGAMQGLKDLAGHCRPVDQESAASHRDQRARVATCFAMAQLALDMIKERKGSPEDLYQTIVEVAQIIPPNFTNNQLLYDSLQQLRMKVIFHRSFSGHPLERGDLENHYQHIAGRLAARTTPDATSFLLQPASLDGIHKNNYTGCPGLERQGSRVFPTAKVVDLLDLAAWIDLEVIQAKNGGADYPAIFDDQCAIRFYERIIEEVIPGALKARRPRAISTSTQNARAVLNLKKYALIAKTNLGAHYYKRGTPSDLEKARVELHNGYQALKPLLHEGSNIPDIAPLKRSLATVLVELGYYGTSNMLATQPGSDSNSLLHLTAKTENLRGSTPHGQKATSELKRIAQNLPKELRWYKSMLLALVEQQAVHRGDIQGTLDRIESTAAEIPDAAFSTYLQRTYAALLTEDLRFSEAQATLEKLPNLMPHGTNRHVEDALTAIAWARLRLAEEKYDQALHHLDIYLDALGPAEKGALQADGALLPEIFSLVARIYFEAGDMERSDRYFDLATTTLEEVQRLDQDLSQELKSFDSDWSPKKPGFWFISTELPLILLRLEKKFQKIVKNSGPEARAKTLSAIADEALCWEQRLTTKEEAKPVAHQAGSGRSPGTPPRTLQCPEIAPDITMDLPLWRQRFVLLRARVLGTYSRHSTQKPLDAICLASPRTSVSLRTEAENVARQIGDTASQCLQ